MAVRDAFTASRERTPPPRFARPCEVCNVPNLAYFAAAPIPQATVKLARESPQVYLNYPTASPA